MTSSSAQHFAHATPDALIIGHVTRDLTPNGWRLGGAAYYAARAASLRGLSVAALTSADGEVAAAARAALPGVTLRIVPADVSTTFENVYHDGARTQFLRAVASPLRAQDIPAAWLAAPVALLAPVAGEVDPDIVAALSPVTRVGLAPQGWLRAWDASGAVQPVPLEPAGREALSHCQAVILSRDDLGGNGASPAARQRVDTMLGDWAGDVACLVITRGWEGAEVWHDGRRSLVPGFPAREVDPTGAGDVFAVTFLCALADGSTPEGAAREANAVAACSVEGEGASAIPTPAAARGRFGL